MWTWSRHCSRGLLAVVAYDAENVVRFWGLIRQRLLRSAKPAPWGSPPIRMKLPPGTSCGPCTICPLADFTRSLPVPPREISVPSTVSAQRPTAILRAQDPIPLGRRKGGKTDERGRHTAQLGLHAGRNAHASKEVHRLEFLRWLVRQGRLSG